MLGAIAGDIIGSPYEHRPCGGYDFQLFRSRPTKQYSRISQITDDSVLTCAVAYSLLTDCSYAKSYKLLAREYPHAGYGRRFKTWAFSKSFEKNDSFGNGSAMRVSPIAYAFDTLYDVLREAEKSAVPTHNHIEGIKGAQAIASCVFFARKGHSKEFIKEFIESGFDYDLSESLESIKKWYKFDVTCQGSVPYAISAFLESTDYEDSIRKAISLDGDSDTLASISGAISEAFYKKIPTYIKRETMSRMPDLIKKIYIKFNKKFK